MISHGAVNRYLTSYDRITQ